MESAVYVSCDRVSASEILEEARTLYNNIKAAGKHATYHDYEKFKHMLHDNGWFGDEYKLAKILHL